MSLKVINREDFEVIFISHSGGFDKVFIVYYVTTNDIKFYRMNYPIDSTLQEAISSSKLDTTEFLIGAIERKHNLHKEVTFEQMDVKVENWGDRCYNLANSYFRKQNRENKINQIIK